MQKPTHTISVPIPPFVATLVGAGIDLTLAIAPSALPEAPRALILSLLWSGLCLTVLPFPAWFLWKLFLRIVRRQIWAAPIAATAVAVVAAIAYVVIGPTLNRWSAPPGLPNVEMCLVSPKDPALVLFNPSRQLAEQVVSAYGLFDLDAPNPNEPLRVPSNISAFIKPGAAEGPQSIFDSIGGVRPKSGDRIVGSIGINCAKCAVGRTYLVAITFGSGGWFSQFKSLTTGGLAIPKAPPGGRSFFDALSYIPILNSVPQPERIQIGAGCP